MADAISTLQIAVEGKDDTTKVLKGIESSIIRFVGAVSATLATISVAVFPIKNAAEFQKELLNVGKTTDFTDAQIATLAEGLKQLSYRLNVSADDLAKVAAAGGQMGLGKEGVAGILSFTEAASRMASVLDVSFEDAGRAFGTLSNIFKIGTKDAERIGSLLNEVSNNSTASGAELIDMVNRIGTAGGVLDIKQATALAAVGKDLGLTVETVGTSFNKIFLDLQAKAKEVAPLLGVPVRDFADTVNKDAIGALKAYVSALSKMDSTQRAIIGEQITGGGRIFGLISSLVKDADNGFVILNKHLAEATVGYDEGTSAIKEQERVLQGLLAQGTILKNVFIGIAEAVGRQALPYLTRLTKQLQEWAKDPTILEFFNRMASFIGAVVDAGIRLIGTISGLSTVMGPLLTILQMYLALKIVGVLGSMTASVIEQGKAVATTAKAWYGLLTANRETVQGIADSVRKVEAKNATLVEAGKKPATISPIGRVGAFMDSALSGKYAMQDQLKAQTASMTEAEKLLNERTAQRLKVLGDIRAEMNNILTTQKAQAQAAYDAVIADGGTKKAAQRAKTDVKSDLNKQLMDLQVSEANLSRAFDDSVKRREANLKSISNQAAQTQQSLANLSSFGLVFASISTMAGKAAAAVGTFFSRFLAIGGAIAGVVGLVTFFLDLFGVLDPVVNALKRMVGIADSAQIEAQRLSAERAAALDAEKKKAAELGIAYDNYKKSKEEAEKIGTKRQDLGTVLDGSLSKEIGVLEMIHGKYADLTFKAAEIASSASLVELRWGEVNKQLAEATTKYNDLLAKQNGQKQSAPLDAKASPFGFRSLVSDKDVAAAKAKVDELTQSLDLLGRARSSYAKDAVKTEEQMKSIAAEAVAQAQKLAPLYDESGLRALQAFEKVLAAQDRLAAAKKAMDDAEKSGNSAKSSDEEKTAYLMAQQKYKMMEEELKVLSTSYEEVKLSSAGATVFMANAFPDAANASIDKVRSLIRVLAGLGDGQNAALETANKNISTQIAEMEKKIADVEARRKSRLGVLSEAIPDHNADNYKQATAKINEDAARDSVAARTRLNDLQAQQKQLALEGEEGKKLKTTYEALGEAKRKASDKGRGLVSNFAEVAALKAFTAQQIDAQRRVEEAAKFNAENIKKLYEEAKSSLTSTINSVNHELRSLGSYFQSRNLALSLANFDIRQNFDNDSYKKFQSEVMDVEKKRLEAQGLSSEEMQKQIASLQEMFSWTDKIRQSQQDEARQRLIINSLQQGMRAEEEAIAAASAAAAKYAREAQDAQSKGQYDTASKLATQAREEAERAKIAAESLTEKLKEYKSEAAKPIIGPTSARFLISDAEEIASTVDAVAKARVQAAQANATALEVASSAAQKEQQDQSTRLEVLKKQADEYQKTLTAIAKLAPELGTAQEAIASKILANTSGMADVAATLKSISESDYRGLDKFVTVADQASKIKQMEMSIREVARTYADSIVPAGETVTKTSQAVVQSLMQSAELSKTVLDGLSSSFAKTDFNAKVNFPSAEEVLQAQLRNKEFVANIKFVSGGDIQKNAEGGRIYGPGTGTSDSILSWVSNGEYISDAQTTSFWGDGFFRTLKSIARGGRAGMQGFATKFSGGISLPAFAEGGRPGAGLLGVGGGLIGLMPQSNDAIIGRVAVDLNVGGEKVSLLGERDQVDALVKALHTVKRGG